MFDSIISKENLLLAWKEFLRGKKKKKDMQIFQYYLLDNINSLHNDLKQKTYVHGGYEAFNISDPKPRNIHKASVRDRLLHYAIHRVIYPYFDKKFIQDSYSCRECKGSHKAMNKFRDFGRIVSKNNTKQCWVLKCDIKKFFASIDQSILMDILKYHKLDKEVIWLIKKVIDSFYSTEIGKGLPLGNLTSQLLVNIYMNEFDQYVKHRLKQKYYIRYADDFVFLSNNRQELQNILHQVQSFLEDNLKLTLHPNKIHLKTLFSGVDFLGWVHFSHHRVLRTVTKRRMIKNMKDNPSRETIQSYLGLLVHGDTHELISKILEISQSELSLRWNEKMRGALSSIR